MSSLERKFKNHPTLETSHKDTIAEYVSQALASKLIKTEAKRTTPSTKHLPHHPIKNRSKPDKIRTVVDAGAKTKNQSLNKHLLKGPDSLNNLVDVLLKFCQRKYAVIGDISQMFHLVQVLPSDSDALRRFLWSFNENLPVNLPYHMNVHLLAKQILQVVRTGLLKRLL